MEGRGEIFLISSRPNIEITKKDLLHRLTVIYVGVSKEIQNFFLS